MISRCVTSHFLEYKYLDIMISTFLDQHQILDCLRRDYRKNLQFIAQVLRHSSSIEIILIPQSMLYNLQKQSH